MGFAPNQLRRKGKEDDTIQGRKAGPPGAESSTTQLFYLNWSRVMFSLPSFGLSCFLPLLWLFCPRLFYVVWPFFPLSLVVNAASPPSFLPPPLAVTFFYKRTGTAIDNFLLKIWTVILHKKNSRICSEDGSHIYTYMYTWSRSERSRSHQGWMTCPVGSSPSLLLSFPSLSLLLLLDVSPSKNWSILRDLEVTSRTGRRTHVISSPTWKELQHDLYVSWCQSYWLVHSYFITVHHSLMFSVCKQDSWHYS